VPEGLSAGGANYTLVDPRLAAQVLRRARAVTAALGGARPPFPPERAAAGCGISEIRGAALPQPFAWLITEAGRPAVLAVDSRIPPHTPQWNGLIALTAARTLLPPGVGGTRADELAEIGAAELLLPARVFRPISARTDLTMDGLRDLASRFSAPIRLTIRQWLLTGTWGGFALLWRVDPSGIRLKWRAASPGARYPTTLAIEARADDVWRDRARLDATFRTGRPHHGVEEVSTGSGPAWWFTRFGIVRDDGGRAALALVVLDRPGGTARPQSPEGINSGSANRRPTAGRRSFAQRRR
jgi:hypothetical protein